MVSVTPLWGVNDKMSLQRYGGSLLSCNTSSLIMGEWPHLHLAGIMRWTKIDVTLVHCLLYGRGYNRDYQLPPYPEVVHLWDDHRNMERFFIYFYLFIYVFICDCGAWGSTPNINFSVVAWHTSWPRVIF